MTVPNARFQRNLRGQSTFLLPAGRYPSAYPPQARRLQYNLRAIVLRLLTFFHFSPGSRDRGLPPSSLRSNICHDWLERFAVNVP